MQNNGQTTSNNLTSDIKRRSKKESSSFFPEISMDEASLKFFGRLFQVGGAATENALIRIGTLLKAYGFIGIILVVNFCDSVLSRTDRTQLRGSASSF